MASGFLQCIRSLWKPVEYPKVRKVAVGLYGDEHSPTSCFAQPFTTNKVITSEFTIWNFLPKTLFRQLTRLANFYFLIIGVIQLLLRDSPTNPLTSFVPLICVISLAIVKQGYEDWLRHKADKAVNKRPVSVIRNGKLTEVFSENVKIGDILYVIENQQLPCDLILLSCEDPCGQCDVMTANLDGETSLKTRICSEPYVNCKSIEEVLKVKCVVDYEKPVPYLYRFSGRLVNMHPITQDIESTIFPLGPEQLLPRGAELRNTSWIFGCAVYLGQDTKMSLNFQKKKMKITRLERTLNRFLFYYILGLILFNIMLVVAKYAFARPTELLLFSFWGMKDNFVNLAQLVDEFLSFIALTNYVVPISLYVTIEMMKMISAYYFKWDLTMHDKVRDIPPIANTSDLIENLGQIEYVFTDKTGTLTENSMEFRYCSAGGRLFRDSAASLREVSSTSHKLLCGDEVHLFTCKDGEQLCENDLEICLLTLCLCHTVRVECSICGILNPIKEECSHDPMSWSYLASSPDELAFLLACRRYGIVFSGRSSNLAAVRFHGSGRRFLVHAEIPWSPKRRKMSIVVEDLTSNVVYLLMKGADSAVVPCCISDEDRTATQRHIQLLAEDGYRVMACAVKLLAPENIDDIQLSIRRAFSCVSFAERERMFDEAAEEFELGLRLIGATAVEDKLQDGVIEVLEDFERCGIKRWVLTGDREETAINICRAAKLFSHKTQMLYLIGKTNISDCTIALGEISERLEKCSKSNEFGIVFDGPTLLSILQCYSQQFAELTTHKSVVGVLGCRLAPLQKAQVVSLIRNGKGRPVCAAVGDGANDVSMILEADVGIAIIGSEGTSAARSCDYAIPSFSKLQRTVFIHGYYFYTRLAVLVLFFFYKNLAFSAAQIYYVYFSLFSAQSLYESFLLTMYNVTFTSLPIFIYSIMEKAHSEHDLLANVSHYARLRRNSYMSPGQFFFWNFTAIFHSVVIFYGCLLSMYNPDFGHDIGINYDGVNIGNYAFGQTTLAITLFVVLAKLAVLTRYWCWPQHAALWFTVFSYFGQMYIYEKWLCSNSMAFLRFECDGSFSYIFQTPMFYCLGMVLMVFALLPDLICRVAFSLSSRVTSSGNGTLPTPVQELCSPAASSVAAVPAERFRRFSSLISHNEEEWVELLVTSVKKEDSPSSISL